MARVIRDQSPSRVMPAAIADARAQAQAILDEARAEAEALRERARVRGLEQAKAQLAAETVAIEQARQRLVEDARDELQRLALRIAERIVGEAVALDDSHVRRVVAEALDRARKAKQAEVHVHPDDAARLHRITADAPLGANLLVVPDARIRPGGCIVHTDRGSVDARLEVKLQAFADALGQGDA